MIKKSVLKKLLFILAIVGLIFTAYYIGANVSKKTNDAKEKLSRLPAIDISGGLKLSDAENQFLASGRFSPIMKIVKAKDFEFKNMETGAETSLFKLSEGKKYMLASYVQSWCQYCRREIISLNAFLENNKNKNFGVVIFTDETGEKEIAKLLKLKKDENLNNITFYISKQNYFASYGINSVPAEIIINKDKNIMGLALGAKNWDKEPMLGYYKKMMKE